MMKAMVNTTFGGPGVFNLKQVPKPMPGKKDVLIKVHATSVNEADRFTRCGKPTRLLGLAGFFVGFFSPKNTILGWDVSGEVEAVGKSVTKFQPGDLVYGCQSVSKANAEYCCVNEDALGLKPSNLSHAQAATIPLAACTALCGFQLLNIKKGDSILILGASGGVGHFALQIAGWYTDEVTALCSTTHIDNAKQMGAKHVIDYTKEDFTKITEKYDVIFDCVGVNRNTKPYTYSRCKSHLADGGTFLTVDPGGYMLLAGAFYPACKGANCNATTENLDILTEKAESGAIKPIIDGTFSLENMAQAHEAFDAGHLHGKISVTILQD